MPVNLDTIAAALADPTADRIIVDKASLSSSAAGQFFSLWRATGQPAQAAIPVVAPAVPTNATLGAMAFTNTVSPIQNFVGVLAMASGNNATSVELWDRVAHNGSLVLNVTTPQLITGFDLAPAGLNLPASRLGAANYSDIQFFMEVYADGGATASNATVNVTYGDGSTGNLTAFAVGGTIRTGRLVPLTPQIPAAQQGRFIRGINSITLSASTGSAGNFGFTAARPRTYATLPIANKSEIFDWAQLGLPVIPNDACLMWAVLCSTTTTGTLRGGGKIIDIDTT